jgi:NAD(P)H dehydrogenase (quinone)
MSQNQSPVLLVTGASGQLGRRVVELLLEAGTEPARIVAATRTPDKLADFAKRGVTVRHADFDQPASLAEAFKGVDRLLLISTDEVMVPGKRTRQHLNAVEAAEAAGVRHVLYTSLVNPGPESPVTLAPDHHATETALANSSMDWTILRNNIYADGLANTLAQAIQTGQLVNAVGDGRIAYICREDCARAAAAALAANTSGRQVFNITGSDAVSQAELAQIASELSGRQIAYVPVPPAALNETLLGFGLPPTIADLAVSFDVAAQQGLLNVVTNTVEELTGQQPTRVRDLIASQRETLSART